MKPFTKNEKIKAFLYLHKDIKSQEEAKEVIDTLEQLRSEWENLINFHYQDVYPQIFISYAVACMKLGDYHGAIKILEEGKKELQDDWFQYFFAAKGSIEDLLIKCYSAVGDADKAYSAGMELAFLQLYAFNSIKYDNFEFYSFRGFSKYSLADIKDETLSHVSPFEFNDPVDTPLFAWLHYKKLDTAYRYWGKKLEEEQLYYETLGKAYSNLRVRCLVRNILVPNKEGIDQPVPLEHQREYANTLMWSHYADYHKGFCVKYVIPSSFTSSKPEDDSLLILRPINYVESFEVKDDFGNIRDISYIDALLTKHKKWEYEHEHRLIYFNRKGSIDHPTPKLPQGSIKAVYIGARASDKDKKKLLEILKDKPEVEVYQMQISSEDLYKLTAKRLNP